MRVSIVLTAAALATGTTAAPTPAPGLISGLLGGVNDILGAVTGDLNKLLSGLGLKLRTDAAKHGPVLNYQDKNPFNFLPVVASLQRFKHDIFWPKGVNGGQFIDWKTFKANGANLGGWLEKERNHDSEWWADLGVAATDEWSLCAELGDKCGPTLEARYSTFLNTTTIDQLASVGVNTLRIPTTYAAWVKVPGSNLYSGNQQEHLKRITQYAISKYGMHCIISLHSLPGGVNSLDIGEAFGHGDWFFDAKNLDYSFKAIDGVLEFIKKSGTMNAFTIAPINEASDTHLQGFGTSAGLTDNGTNWVNTYHDGVLKKIAQVDKRIPMMVQDNFKGAGFWSPFYDASANIVIDSHVYYFAAAGTYSQYLMPTICGQAQYLAQDTKFPVFVGEWALQVRYNNTREARKSIFDTQRYAWQKYVAGGAFWTAVSYTDGEVDGEGAGPQRDYWSFVALIKQGVIAKETDQSYC